MTTFIDVQRRFHELTDSELEDTELLGTLSDPEFGPSIGWSKLLQYARVVLLAEAGAGKTREMREQTKRLVEQDQFAFFIPLESLDRDPVASLLSTEEEKRFEQWKADGQELAWFFLDAVDELRLTEGKLDRALNRLSKAVNGHLGRARVVISCRPSDWRPGHDPFTVQERLPMPARRSATSCRTSDDAFIEALRKEHGGQARTTRREEELPDQGDLRTVAMLPMNDRQIEAFAKWSDVKDAAAFLSEITRQKAWTFARRPLDLADLIRNWSDSGHLGTRAEQHEMNAKAKLKDNPMRPDCGVLADRKARLGAERLALALTLTRTRTIRSPDQALEIQRADGVLDAAEFLSDWTDAERQTLLRRALFDPATYGRVRFHHRSVQEYLAAARLLALRDSGMSTKGLLRLLFAERYGIEVVIPSMRPIAAWLATRVCTVREELTKREPETLLSFGDPESLDLAARSDLLRAFVARYDHGYWRGLHVTIDDARRLAHPDLASVIRECWGAGPANDEVFELLVTVIWKGPVDACADLVHSVAHDSTASTFHRILAILALLACGRKDSVRVMADVMLAEPQSWPDRVIHGVAADLFPEVITADELTTLMERTREPKQVTGGFGWVSQRIAQAIDPASKPALALRDKMTDLIWHGRGSELSPHRAYGKYGHLAPALATLCDRQLSKAPKRADTALIRASVIASRFGDSETSRREPVLKLRAHFEANAVLRCKAFWSELALMDEIAPTQNDWLRLHHAQEDSLVGFLVSADWPWLETALADQSHTSRRAVALHALIDIWRRRGKSEAELYTIRTHLEGDTDLGKILDESTRPPEQNEQLERSDREHSRWKREQACHETRRLDQWKQWRDEMLSDPADAFSGEKRHGTVSNLYRWLEMAAQGWNRYNIWNKSALKEAFGVDIADRAEETFRALWRTKPPVPWSARSATERNRILYEWIYGLLGVYAESETPGWTAHLSSREAKTAAAFATIELNGLAPFIADLARSHPAEVGDVIGGEVSAELQIGGDHAHLPTLQSLTHADGHLKQLLLPHLLAELKSWPSTCSPETDPTWEVHLDQVLCILAKASSETDRETVAQECFSRCAAAPTRASTLAWLRGLFRFDAVRGAEALVKGLGDRNASDTRSFAIEAFATLFGGHDAVSFEVPDPSRRAHLLGQLVRHAYGFVRREDDHVHEGVYTPSTRDDAETARGFLLSKLLDTPGSEANRVILELADEDDFAHLRDRLRYLARQQAATDAEFSPFSPENMAELYTRCEAPPRDRDGLFAIMMDRLHDLAYDLRHHDFSDRGTVQTITDEAAMQRTLAMRIDARSNGAYSVTREEEVADGKRTDIRLLAPSGAQKAAIEVKIADNGWSLPDLRRALHDQLVGRYLRHSNCRAGCLLLTYHGRKRYWINPETRKRLKFLEVVALLIDEARILEKESSYGVRLAVFGLDLTDP